MKLLSDRRNADGKSIHCARDVLYVLTLDAFLYDFYYEDVRVTLPKRRERRSER